ncbi:DUF4190 domain-containing protein [Actinomadura violacea]|uniref:DUF4190 domain-containing protein n=1 Tax=Actinomadura violacea TaxID=2819934 RepID=A0ABS3RHB9_9ACTN|nr:DUF4190 domain-containing protein [Actinomadura violacea]MBO2456117.1 DUF4190 domain-containing protein [Actinomadura violacea]
MTLPGYQTYSPPAPPRRSGLARASLVLGIVGLLGLALCLLGLIPAIVGLVLGTIALVRGQSERWPAVAGVVCCAIAVVVGVVALVWLLSKAAMCGDTSRYPNDEARQGCVEQEFPFVRDTSNP